MEVWKFILMIVGMYLFFIPYYIIPYIVFVQRSDSKEAVVRGFKTYTAMMLVLSIIAGVYIYIIK